MMAAILNSTNLNMAILDSAILVYPLKLTHTCQDWYPPFAEKKLHSFILTQLGWWQPSWILPFCRNQTSPIHSHSTWWGQPSWILPSWIQPFCTKKDSFIHFDSTWWWQPSWILPCWIQTLPIWIQTPCYLLSDSLKNTLTPLWLWLQTNSIWLTGWWQSSWIQPFYKNLWFKLIQSDSKSFILTQLDDGCYLGFSHCHLGFSHLSFYTQTH